MVRAWVLAASVGVGVAAQERGVAIPAAVREAQGVLVAAFPELREGRVVWRIVTTATGVAVEARQPATPFEDLTAMAPVVAAAVTVDEQGGVAGASRRARHARSSRARARRGRRPARAMPTGTCGRWTRSFRRVMSRRGRRWCRWGCSGSSGRRRCARRRFARKGRPEAPQDALHVARRARHRRPGWPALHAGLRARSRGGCCRWCGDETSVTPVRRRRARAGPSGLGGGAGGGRVRTGRMPSARCASCSMQAAPSSGGWTTGRSASR